MAEDQDDSQKTEEPTQKKLDDARKKGQTALSREVNHWFMILAGFLIILAFAPAMLRDLANGFSGYLAGVHAVPTDRAGLGNAMVDALVAAAKALLVPMIVIMAAGIGGTLVQTGPIASVERLKPKLDKISLIKGLKRQFSLKSIAEFVKGILKLVIVGAVGVLLLMPMMMSIEHYAGIPMLQMLSETRGLAIRLMIGVLSVMTVIAGLDLLYQRFEFNKSMRMSKQELKDEMKQTEGDPMIKARLRQIRTERARRRMMTQVPKADVIITNPTHFAVALQYDPQAMEAPILLAKGVDLIAQKIREVALEHEIPIVENPPLARALHASVELDQQIPPEHYRAVAEIISYVFKLKKRTVKTD